MFCLQVLVHKRVSTFFSHYVDEGFYNATRDMLQHHYDAIHKEQDEATSDVDASDFQRRAIACKACAKAKTRCDRAVSFN